MKTIDYNGEGCWSAIEIRSRYAHYAAEAGIVPRDVSPMEHTSEEGRWIYPVMDKIIEGIKAHDPACIRIGIEFIEEHRKFTFGKTLKANTARALRRAPLAQDQKDRVLRRVFGLLQRGCIPHEYRQYARLARRVGFRVSDIPSVDHTNPYVARFHRYFVGAASHGT